MYSLCLLQNYYFLDNNAIEISKDGILNINIEKMVPTAQKMLEEIIQIQMSGDFKQGEDFVLKNFVWTDGMQKIADNFKKVSKTLNGRVENELADQLLKD